MARRSKATQILAAPELAAMEQVPVLNERPVGARRSPKPKLAVAAKSAKPSKKSAAAAVVETAALRAEVLDTKVGATTPRGRTNGKAKRAGAAPVALSKPSAKAAKPIKRLQARKPQNISRDAELDAPAAAASDAAVAPPVGVVSPTAIAPHSKAAQWDRTTGAVRFDWNEIEQMASRQGPNQGMARLLVAARAEGANSRWPF